MTLEEFIQENQTELEKDYEKFAEMFRAELLTAKNHDVQTTIECLMQRFAIIAETDNPRFDRERFFDACYA